MDEILISVHGSIPSFAVMDRPWRLVIEKDNSNCLTVYGTEEVLRIELDDWVAFEDQDSEAWKQSEEAGQSHVSTTSFKVRRVIGFTDTADRSTCVVAYRFRDVIGMTLTEM